MRVIRQTGFGVLSRCLFFVCVRPSARSNHDRDRHERRRRAAAIAGLRTAAPSRARLYMGAGLLGLGRRPGYYWVPGTWV